MSILETIQSAKTIQSIGTNRQIPRTGFDILDDMIDIINIFNIPEASGQEIPFMGMGLTPGIPPTLPVHNIVPPLELGGFPDAPQVKPQLPQTGIVPPLRIGGFPDKPPEPLGLDNPALTEGTTILRSKGGELEIPKKNYVITRTSDELGKRFYEISRNGLGVTSTKTKKQAEDVVENDRINPQRLEGQDQEEFQEEIRPFRKVRQEGGEVEKIPNPDIFGGPKDIVQIKFKEGGKVKTSLAINRGTSSKGFKKYTLLDKEGNELFGKVGKSEKRLLISHPSDIVSEKQVAQNKHTGFFQVLKESDFVRQEGGE